MKYIYTLLIKTWIGMQSAFNRFKEEHGVINFFTIIIVPCIVLCVVLVLAVVFKCTINDFLSEIKFALRAFG